MKYDLPPFALLIDADNVRLDSISPILEEITRHARVTVRRIYGDFTTPNLAGWRTKLAEHAIHPVQQYRNTVGKNASDSALIIDAMDLLHSKRFEGFCLVSSDGDFTRLATRIREDGLVVYGFGEQKAPKAFVSACDRYIYVENLLASPRDETPIVDARPPGMSANRAAADGPNGNEPSPPVESPVAAPTPAPTPAQAFKPPALATNLLMRAYTNVADDLGWALLSQLSSYIHANQSDFDPRTYGCTKFIDLIQKTAALELVQRPHKNGHSHFCRPATASQPAPNGNAPRKPTSSEAFHAALRQAVNQATGANGWALVSTVGQKLKSLGHSVEGSGRTTLTDALKATGLFEMRGTGAARYFRLKGPSSVTA